jgi:hypothetical protein
MFNDPDMLLAQAHQRQRELIAEADRYRLLALAKRARQGRRARDARRSAAAVSVAAVTVEPCGRHEVASAR